MDRREALKKIGLSFGFALSTPAAISLLQGCAETKTPSWNPLFFNEDEADFVTKTVDIILPPTKESPGASEVGVPQFIDQYLQEVVSVDEQDLTKSYLSNIISNLKYDTGKEEASEITSAEIEPIIATSLIKSPEENEQMMEKVHSYTQAIENGEKSELFGDVASFALLNNLRELAIWSYKTSQTVGEKFLAYDPIPGRQQGCITVQEATGGKAWSL